MISGLLGYVGTAITAIGIEIANIGLLSGLLYLYIKSYRQIKIGFTVGLILFASVLLIKSVSTIVLLIIDNDAILNYHGIIGGIIEFIALAILLKVTWDY